MKISQYIIIKKNERWSRQGYFNSRLTQKKPALAANEVAVRVELDLPDAVFSKPAFEATIKVPESAVSKPVINAEVIDNVENIIQQTTGFTVKLVAVTEKEDDK